MLNELSHYVCSSKSTNLDECIIMKHPLFMKLLLWYVSKNDIVNIDLLH